MNVSEQDKKKKRYSIVAGMLFIGLMVFIEILTTWAYLTEPDGAPPIFLMIFLWLIPFAFILGTVAVMRERLKEIEGGEENEAAKY